DLDGAFALGEGKTRIDLRRLHLNSRSMPQHADANAVIEAHLVIPDIGALAASLAFVGTVGGIGAKVNGASDGNEGDGVVDVPRAEAAQVRAMLASAPIDAPVTAHLEAHGVLPEIAPRAHVTLGDGRSGTVDIEGHLKIPRGDATAMRADATVRARGIDV